MGIKETLSRALGVVLQKENQDLDEMIHSAQTGEHTAQIIFERERKRLDDVGVHDHEEVFAGTGIYTNGRSDGTIVRMSNIRKDGWVETGE